MEMLVVVAIIVVLAGVGGTYLIGQLNESKVSAAERKAKTVGQALEMYNVDHSPICRRVSNVSAAPRRTRDGKGPYLKIRR